MKKLLLRRNEIVADDASADLQKWDAIYKMIPRNVSLVDRCGYVSTPYVFENKFSIPKDLSNFNKTYEQVCVERAEQLIAHSRQLGKPLLLLYSGGIDSTTVLVSFIKAAGNNTRDIIVALNPASIQENPRFYYQHIRGKFRLMASERALDLIDGEYVMVGGEFNDQLFGSDILLSYKNLYGFDRILEPYNEGNIVPFFINNGMSVEYAKFWFDLMDQQIKATNLCEVKSVRDFFWWYNFCFKWQSVYYRIIARTSRRELITDQFISDYYHQFFESQDFQRWSMLNPDKKIVDSWESYKISAKQMIFEYTKDQDYFKNKMKLGSLFGIFKKRSVPDALAYDTDTHEYIFIDNSDCSEYYDPDNSFN
jgi:hypothetical protein